MRAGWKRTYIKMHITPCLQGSIRYQLEPDERGVWYDLIMFSAICVEPGLISDSDSRPYPYSFIANRLNISKELLETTLKKCIEEGRITEDEHGIRITNWASYQSEYQRQLPYRQGKKPGKKANKVCPSCGYKGFTDEEYCPDCEKKGQGIKLDKDYHAGPYGKLIKS